jgi:hypothetical protein
MSPSLLGLLLIDAAEAAMLYDITVRPVHCAATVWISPRKKVSKDKALCLASIFFGASAVFCCKLKYTLFH